MTLIELHTLKVVYHLWVGMIVYAIVDAKAICRSFSIEYFTASVSIYSLVLSSRSSLPCIRDLFVHRPHFLSKMSR